MTQFRQFAAQFRLPSFEHLFMSATTPIKHDGFATTPKTMSLAMCALDEVFKGQAVGPDLSLRSPSRLGRRRSDNYVGRPAMAGTRYAEGTMVPEEPKRLAHTKEVLRELFAKSGSFCAYSGCAELMIDKSGLFVGQICHIEGVRGERFNPLMSNEQRAAAANLILMSYRHHVETNDELAFPVSRLAKMKADHEALFSDPGMRMYKAYVDQAVRKGLRKATTAQRFANTFGWHHTPTEARETADDINQVGEKLARLDVQSRLFLCAVVDRAHLVRNTANVRSMGSLWLRLDDFAASYLATPAEIYGRLTALEAHRLGRADSLDIGDCEVPAILLYETPTGGWDLWSAIGEFCEVAGEPIETILVDLQFDRLD